LFEAAGALAEEFDVDEDDDDDDDDVDVELEEAVLLLCAVGGPETGPIDG